MSIDWKQYDPHLYFDELIASKGEPRLSARHLVEHLESLDDTELESCRQMAEATIREMGVSFTVYTEEGNIDRAWPFDIVPRTISATHPRYPADPAATSKAITSGSSYGWSPARASSSAG